MQSGALDKIKLFEPLDKFQKLKLVDGLKRIQLKLGDFVLREGDDGQEFYIIEQGEVDCLKLHVDEKRKGFIHVRTLK